MCFSAQVWAAYDKFVRVHGAIMDIKAFYRTFIAVREAGHWNRLPKAMRDAFRTPADASGFALARLVAEGDRAQLAALDAELVTQRERLARAETVLAGGRPTKKAAEDRRIAARRIEAAERRRADLQRREPDPDDARIYPGSYAPVMVWEEGRRVVRPMRYQCRPAGKPASWDQRYPGTYNARRDNLEGAWKAQFGHTHGLLVVETFYENVPGPDGRNRVLQFTPRDREPMLVACLWSRWDGPGETLLSFAAITDEPEPEVAAAGHDRTIVTIRPEHIDAWLRPDPARLDVQYAILDDRRHPYYEHRIAA